MLSLLKKKQTPKTKRKKSELKAMKNTLTGQTQIIRVTY
jgi:hypothetical protein